MSGTREGERERESEEREHTCARFAARVQGRGCGCARPPRTGTVGCTNPALGDDVWCTDAVPPPQKVTHRSPGTHVALHTCVALHSWPSCGLESTQGCVATSLHGFSTTEAGLGLTPTPPVALRHGGEQKKGHAVWCHPLSHSWAPPYRNAHSESPERSRHGAQHQPFFTWDPAPGRERCPPAPTWG